MVIFTKILVIFYQNFSHLLTKFLVIMSLDLLAGSYPLPKVRDNRVFFLQLNAFEALKMVKDVSAAPTVSFES